MPRTKKSGEQRKPRRKLHFERPYDVKLEDLLDYYMRIIGDVDTELDMKIDKITITLEANKAELEKTVMNLQILQGQLIRATTEDENGNYNYEQGLFLFIFKSQIQTKFLSQIIKSYNYHSDLTDSKTIVSNISLDELQRIQDIGFHSINNAPRDQNKDIQNFASIVSMKTGRAHDEVLQLGIANELLSEKDGNLHFTDDPNKVMEQIIEIAEDLSITPTSTQDIPSVDDEKFGGFGFDGGKIVFVDASNDHERSTFEDQEENKEQ
ncbi:MAG: DUF2067 domain-containing protein [Candidatus Heimdallarchaeota archaeon]|nr:DUF2067 domain-containing protein [Candidatus Heimdallarchaeota archaeon]